MMGPESSRRYALASAYLGTTVIDRSGFPRAIGKELGILAKTPWLLLQHRS
jgi:hypothetical protein